MSHLWKRHTSRLLHNFVTLWALANSSMSLWKNNQIMKNQCSLIFICSWQMRVWRASLESQAEYSLCAMVLAQSPGTRDGFRPLRRRLQEGLNQLCSVCCSFRKWSPLQTAVQVTGKSTEAFQLSQMRLNQSGLRIFILNGELARQACFSFLQKDGRQVWKYFFQKEQEKIVILSERWVLNWIKISSPPKQSFIFYLYAINRLPDKSEVT